MNDYSFPTQFRQVYDRAVAAYAAGRKTADTLVSAEDRAFLERNGIGVQAMVDYAEDHNNYGEPGPEQALSIELIRRHHFLHVQNRQPSNRVLDEASLPGKTEAVRGIEWLPRILPKARAKLAGELPPSLMYCCGGDRRFFKAHDIVPAEFLALIAQHERDEPIVAFVAGRSAANIRA
ncbi:MAG: DUF5069 domain-containing protein [Opitutaceae bacterium]|nr:DUF5069 domain-containing protein [Opitutaceae bacterium]